MKKKRSKRAKIKRIANLKKNPSGGILDLGKKALPGGAALLATLFISSRLEALVAGNVMAPAPSYASASKMQKAVAFIAPAALVLLVHFVTKKWMQKHRLSLLVGAGAAAALRYVGLFLGMRSAAALPLPKTATPMGAHERQSFFGLPSAKVTSRVAAVETDDDQIDDDLSLDGSKDPEYGDLFEGTFGAN